METKKLNTIYFGTKKKGYGKFFLSYQMINNKTMITIIGIAW